ncbi:hypothetical protein K437DRAFT_260159 [Tilletiaria anomala UBC 951]|uniref:Uncharacterized protein n=1 Tax=Tilletiaria anomala (strain ATCC 24038 / CBS 436.72 / UBC 951) TaxID=1037660 RepID=A0A066V3N0_TILAU|nr:uncharacterized protein K437DRAFT_260159 [Tilletiaria anomala UBC 951]KDN36322.1 hypothetical protein K437DRAFT_260159 [Tilletiaria anomala UBC 951]
MIHSAWACVRASILVLLMAILGGPADFCILVAFRTPLHLCKYYLQGPITLDLLSLACTIMGSDVPTG